jgi:hypothetical protein
VAFETEVSMPWRGPRIAIPVTQQTIQTVASLAGAVGTISAVGLALFLQVFRTHRRKPNLSLGFSPVVDDEDLALVDDESDQAFLFA